MKNYPTRRISSPGKKNVPKRRQKCSVMTRSPNCRNGTLNFISLHRARCKMNQVFDTRSGKIRGYFLCIARNFHGKRKCRRCVPYEVGDELQIFPHENAKTRRREQMISLCLAHKFTIVASPRESYLNFPQFKAPRAVLKTAPRAKKPGLCAATSTPRKRKERGKEIDGAHSR